MVRVFKEIWDEEIWLKESVIVLYLTNSLDLVGYFIASVGGRSLAGVDIGLIMQRALLVNSNNIIMAHNHPSGNPKPSNADKELTKRVSQAARLLDMRLVDHLIFTPQFKYYSFAHEGMLD